MKVKQAESIWATITIELETEAEAKVLREVLGNMADADIIRRCEDLEDVPDKECVRIVNDLFYQLNDLL